MKISFLQIVLISCLFVSHLLKRPSRSRSLSLSLSSLLKALYPSVKDVTYTIYRLRRSSSGR